MRYKVRYPDEYIRAKRSIVAAAEMTYVYRDVEGFVVSAGEDTYVLPELDCALDLAANHVLGDGPLDSLEFIQDGDGTWIPDMRVLRRALEVSGRSHKK